MKNYSDDQMRQRIIFERADYREIMSEWPYVPEEVAEVKESVLDLNRDGPTRVLIYYPKGSKQKPLPALLIMHGGGWIRGRADDDDRFCRRTANEAGCVVFNLDYKLAPEYKFPVPLNECYDLYLWMRGHAEELGIDKDRIAVGGHSAGGSLAAGMCLKLKDEGKPLPLCQVLDYPSVIVSNAPEFPGFKNGIELDPMGRALLFIECFFASRDDAETPYASPLLATSQAGMPPTLIVIAGDDMLRKSQEAYAAALQRDGVEVETEIYPDCGHGFTVWPNVSTAETRDAAWKRINGYLKTRFETK